MIIAELSYETYSFKNVIIFKKLYKRYIAKNPYNVFEIRLNTKN
jgi:hypothetical protein